MPRDRKLTLKQRHDHLLESHATALDTIEEQRAELAASRRTNIGLTEKWGAEERRANAAESRADYNFRLAKSRWDAMQKAIADLVDMRRLAARRLEERDRYLAEADREADQRRELQLKLGRAVTEHNEQRASFMRREAGYISEAHHLKEQLVRMSHLTAHPPVVLLDPKCDTRPGAVNRVVEVEPVPEEPKTARVWWVLAWASVVSAVCGIINVAHTVH